MDSLDEITKLSASRVEDILKDCLFRENEDTAPGIKAFGIVTNYGFEPGRLQTHTEEITALLHELPVEFMSKKNGGGGGWSFLNGCMDRHGNQWGEQMNVEQLFCLGLAIGKVECLMPREMWAILPGGMPYYSVED